MTREGWRDNVRPQQGESAGQWLFLVHFWARAEPAKAAATAAAASTRRTIAGGCGGLSCKVAKRCAAVKRVCNAAPGFGRVVVVVYEDVGRGFQVGVLKRQRGTDGFVCKYGAGAGFP